MGEGLSPSVWLANPPAGMSEGGDYGTANSDAWTTPKGAGSANSLRTGAGTNGFLRNPPKLAHAPRSRPSPCTGRTRSDSSARPERI
jgi:hypothetical protein